MWASLGAWFVKIALPLVLNWAKGLFLEGIALLAALILRNKKDTVIDEKNDEAAKPIEEIIKEPEPATPEEKEKRKEAVRDAAKDLLG